MKLFISYHLADTRYVNKIKEKLSYKQIEYYSVPENINFDGIHNEEISRYILSKMLDCQVLLCVLGKETYTRPHVDYEIHQSLKGGVGRRLGIIIIFLEARGDSIYNIDYSSFPPRLLDNETYIVKIQNSALLDQIDSCIRIADENRINPNIQVVNSRNCMQLPNKYYQE